MSRGGFTSRSEIFHNQDFTKYCELCSPICEIAHNVRSLYWEMVHIPIVEMWNTCFTEQCEKYGQSVEEPPNTPLQACITELHFCISALLHLSRWYHHLLLYITWPSLPAVYHMTITPAVYAVLIKPVLPKPSFTPHVVNTVPTKQLIMKIQKVSSLYN